ncbi:uncharacterized protein LOC131230834 [Magnolia sinica]|uniref:uncharacterized protein LOC131230834 n=1 Tax=Magnolia sinica TaxID=86752 RepID=UPI00265B5DC0|nr:uncharacterized protein LOC131230834 [Magnolia sinica]
MPTFTAIALESLLEPTVGDSSPKNPFPSKQLPKQSKELAAAPKRSSHIDISPALYTTPKSALFPNSPASVSPSPYVVNRKRRDVPPPNNRLDGFQVEHKPEEQSVLEGGDGLLNPMGEHCAAAPLIDVEEEEEMNGSPSDVGGGEILVKEGNPERDEVCLDGFTDTRDSMSITSSCDADDGSCLRRSFWKQTPVLSQSEFYDAPEEFFSDSSASSPSFSSNLEIELRAVRLSLFEEIERRKKAEETLGRMQNQWQRIVDRLSEFGFSFPLTSDAGNAQLEVDSTERFCQEVVVARFVSEAIGRGQARAETEAAAEAIVDSKNHEISRLQDKVQYYEAVNHEMCQRNQEVKELSRRQRRTRKTRQRWIWSCIGLSIALGASVLVYSYIPHAGESLSPASDASQTPSGMPESRKVL